MSEEKKIFAGKIVLAIFLKKGYSNIKLTQSRNLKLLRFIETFELDKSYFLLSDSKFSYLF